MGRKTYGITLKRSLIVKLGTTNFSSSTCSSGESTATVRFLSVAFEAIGEVGEGSGEGERGEEEGRKEIYEFYQVGVLGKRFCVPANLNEKSWKFYFAHSEIGSKALRTS